MRRGLCAALCPGNNAGLALGADSAQQYSLDDWGTMVDTSVKGLMYATRMLLRNGPQGGDLRDVRTNDTLIASADPVAADAYATTLFGLQPDAIESTVAAHRMGLGEMDLQRIRVVEG